MKTSSYTQAPIPVLHPITRLIVGGAQENTLFTAALLDKTRFRTEILSGPQTGSEGSLIDEARQRGLTLHILPQMLRQVSPQNDLLALWKLYRMMRGPRYAIVHTHSSKAGILGRIAARMAGVPVIIHTVHGWSFHDYMSPTIRNTYVLLERLTATFSDALIVVASKDQEKGLRAGIGNAGQYRLIRSAIPLQEFNPVGIDRQSVRMELGIPQNVPVLGNVGRFSEQKNPLDWVRVASEVGRALPDVYFLLVGDGPLRQQVEAAVAQHGLAERCIFTGLRRDVPRIMRAMDVFLITSLWEGLPRVIPQAMSMGLPVIGNRADGTVEAIQDGITGYLCTPGSYDEMAARCIDLLSQPVKGQEMGCQGRIAAAQEFDLGQMISQIEALYTELLAKKGISPFNERSTKPE